MILIKTNFVVNHVTAVYVLFDVQLFLYIFFNAGTCAIVICCVCTCIEKKLGNRVSTLEIVRIAREVER